MMDIIKILEEVEFVMRDYGFDEEEEKLRAVINYIENEKISINMDKLNEVSSPFKIHKDIIYNKKEGGE